MSTELTADRVQKEKIILYGRVQPFPLCKYAHTSELLNVRMWEWCTIVLKHSGCFQHQEKRWEKTAENCPINALLWELWTNELWGALSTKCFYLMAWTSNAISKWIHGIKVAVLHAVCNVCNLSLSADRHWGPDEIRLLHSTINVKANNTSDKTSIKQENNQNDKKIL